MKGMLSCITIARPQAHHLIGESISVSQFPPAPKPAPREIPARRKEPRPAPRPAARQEAYQLSIADIMQQDEHHTAQWSFASAASIPRTPSSSSTRTPDAAEGTWSAAHSDTARSDRSSSLEDVIPPSIWRVGRPAARHPVSATPARRHISMSHVGPAPTVVPPAFWGVVKHPLSHRAPSPPKSRRRPRPARCAPATTVLAATTAATTTTRGVRGNITARQDPAWQAAMKTTGKGISVTMGLYLDGEITVNGHYAATVLRDPPCERCRMAGRECRVVDGRKEKNLVSGICSYCIRQRRKCAT